jgi:hypothetical protein
MNNEKKVFAFKLAEKKEKAANARWKAREGVSLAGCTDPIGDGSYREYEDYGGPAGVDQGYWC